MVGYKIHAGAHTGERRMDRGKERDRGGQRWRSHLESESPEESDEIKQNVVTDDVFLQQRSDSGQELRKSATHWRV